MTHPLGEAWEPEPLPVPETGLIRSGPLQKYFREQQLAYAAHLASLTVLPLIHQQIQDHVGRQIRQLADSIGPIPITVPGALIKQLGPLGLRALIQALEEHESELRVVGLEPVSEPEQDLCFCLYPPGTTLPEEPAQEHWVPDEVVKQATTSS